MSELLRGETYLRERYANQPILEEQTVLSDDELAQASRLLMDRFNSRDRNRLVDTPELLSLMYGWREVEDEAAVRAWTQEQANTDAGLLALLSSCRTWMQTNSTVQYPLMRRDLSNFLDFDVALRRLRGMVENMDRSENERTLAGELLNAAELGEGR